MKKPISITKDKDEPLLSTNQSPDMKRLNETVLTLNTLACQFKEDGSPITHEDKAETEAWLKALNANDGIEKMLAAQMLSVHHLQQITMAMANKSMLMERGQYFLNATTKLANIFVQQANLLAKLQGRGQKIVVEHVEVHHGGQAVVGNITTPTGVK